jgi:hypothetical protein
MEHKNKLFYLNNQEYFYDFLGERLSSDGGLFLLEKAEKAIHIIKYFGSLISDERQKGKINFSVFNMLKMRVFGIAQGYEDCNDFDGLKGDAAFDCVCGMLSSQPTLTRFENSISIKDLFNLSYGFIDRYVDSLSPDQKQIIIDVDATDDPTHGQQELSFYNGYYMHTSYTELLFHDGTTGQLILPVLRPGNAHSNKWFVSCLRRIVNIIRKKCPDTEIILRGDTGYSGAKFFSYAKKAGIKHVTGLASNSRLREITDFAEKIMQEKYLNKKMKATAFVGPFEYKAESWDEPLYCYAKIESTGHNLLTRYYCTNIEKYESQKLYEEFYTKRADSSENRIKELKNMCFSDRLSCHKFTANFFRLILSSITYELLRTLRDIINKGGFEKEGKWQISSIRLKLLKIGAKIKKTKKRVTVHFADHYLYQDIFSHIVKSCS